MKTLTKEEFEKQYGAEATTKASETAKPSNRTIFGVADKVTNFLGLDGATKVFGNAIARTKVGAALTGTDVEANRANIEAPTKGQLAGAGLQTAATALAPLIPVPAGLMAKVAAGAAAGYAYDIGQDLVNKEDVGSTVLPGAGAAVGAIIPGAGPVGKGVAKTAAAAAGAVADAAGAVTRSPVVKGALQNAIELGERVPRFISRRNIELRDAASRAERIANSPAPIGNALKSGLDERIINTIEQADESTRQAYGEIVRLAEESVAQGGTLKMPVRPEIVAGNAAADQYKLIDGQRKKIGQAIGDAVKNLSTTEPVSMAPARVQLNEIMKDAGIDFVEAKDGATLNFGKTGFTNAQRKKIKELYNLATEGGDSLTPAQIHAKDRLFSQLSREARMSEVGDILIDTVDANGEPTKVSLFQAFRDVYSDTLEQVAPEIRPLNRQYRNLSTFTEEIEKSIIKSGKYETNSNVDPAEFAQTNLRRLFSEAQSAADYRKIAEEMDAASRALGYQGATPSDLAQFAYEIRKIYPETTPRTSAEGVFGTNIIGMLTNSLKAGAPGVEDQQKALRELIDYLEQQQ